MISKRRYNWVLAFCSALLIVGFCGCEGPKGEQGEQGEPGSQGERGPQGELGEQGPQGELGPKGDPGDAGPPGDQGPQGEQGEKGDPGETGETGDPGEPGETTHTDSSVPEEEEADTDLPRAHWVLWDKDGDPVDADVYPNWAEIEKLFEKPDTNCVQISYLGDKLIGLYYGLETGHINDCDPPYYVNYDSWKDYSSNRYLDDNCTGAWYLGYFSLNSYAGIGYPKQTILIDSTYYYVDGEPDVLSPSIYYTWNATTGECEEKTNSSEYDFWAYKPVPDWVLNALPDAPYTLTLEY